MSERRRPSRKCRIAFNLLHLAQVLGCMMLVSASVDSCLLIPCALSGAVSTKVGGEDLSAPRYLGKLGFRRTERHCPFRQAPQLSLDSFLRNLLGCCGDLLLLLVVGVPLAKKGYKRRGTQRSYAPSSGRVL